MNRALLTRLVDTSLRLRDRPCIGSGCDEGRPCKRHARTAAVAYRLERMRGRKVA